MEKENYNPSWLVPIDIAKELKEIGFNEYCPFIVYPNDNEVVVSGTVTVEEDWIDDDNYGEVIIDLPVWYCGKLNKYNFQTVPTWEQAFEWFRKKGYNFSIELFYNLEDEKWSGYEYYIEKYKGGINASEYFYFETYEEAREECLKSLISIEQNGKSLNQGLSRDDFEHVTVKPSYVMQHACDPEFMRRQEDAGLVTDGYHTFDELYRFRKVYNALLFNEWAKQGLYRVHKSWKHEDGEWCFGKKHEWFIVCAKLPSGIITNHYKAEDWDLFQIPEYLKSIFPYDGHTPQDTVDRMLELIRTSGNKKEFVEIWDGDKGLIIADCSDYIRLA